MRSQVAEDYFRNMEMKKNSHMSKRLPEGREYTPDPSSAHSELQHDE